MRKKTARRKSIRDPVFDAAPAEISKLPNYTTEVRPISISHRVEREQRNVALDMHYPLELGIVLRGRIRRYYPRWKTDVKSGEVWFCGIWEPHGWAVKQTPCEAIVLTIRPELLAFLRFPEAPKADWMAPFLVPPRQRPRVSPRLTLQIHRIGRSLRALYGKGAPMELLTRRLLVMELLHRITAQWMTSHAGGVKPVEESEKISRSIDLAFRNQRLIKVSEAAGVSGMSPKVFRAVFKRLIGLTFPQFALRCRLHGVTEELCGTRLPLKAIASHWGFTDHSHLGHAFLARYGCSPRIYRGRSLSD